MQQIGDNVASLDVAIFCVSAYITAFTGFGLVCYLVYMLIYAKGYPPTSRGPGGYRIYISYTYIISKSNGNNDLGIVT